MKRRFRFTLPGHIALTAGNWFFGFWDWRHRKGFPEIGIRILGFEYWVEYWHWNKKSSR